MKKFKEMNKKEKRNHMIIWILIIVFFIGLYFFNQSIDRIDLIDSNGMSFAKGTVVEIISENRNEDGTQLGTQIVNVLIKSGEYQGKIIQTTNIDSYLYGADCKIGTKVIVQLSEYNGTVSASVYNYDRTNVLYIMIAIFFISLLLIGKKKGLTAILGLVFTFICILYLYLPMMYIGISPFVSACLVAILTTLVTMYFIGGLTMKTLCAILGTICGVVLSGIFAFLFGKISHINGYNVSDIETLIFIGQNSQLDVSGLLFSGILIASLGAIMDVAISISTTMEELVFHNPQISRKQLLKSGIKIGGDMMGTMSNTLILAFTGSSLSTLMIFYSYKMTFLQMFNSYDIGIEIIQGISGSLGVVLTVPFVALISSLFMYKNK